MDLVKLLGKLQSIGLSEAEDKADKDYDKDGKVESEKDEVWGSRMKAAEKSKANEDIENVLRGLLAIQEGNQKVEEDDVEEGNEFAKKVQDLKAQGAKPGTKFKTSDGKEHVLEAEDYCDACDRPVSKCVCDDHDHVDEALNVPKLSALVGVDGQKLRAAVMRSQQGQPTRSDIILLADTFVKILTNPDDKAIQDVANLIKAGNNKATPKEQPAEESVQLGECGDMSASPLSMMGAAQAPEQKDRYTLTITKGDGSSLNATTDVPEELMQIMKLAGISVGGEVTQAPAGEEAAVEEEFGNTPAATQEREPRLHGDTKDWGLPGTARAKTQYTPAQQGDNPMAESMFEEYKQFKTGK